MEPTMRWIVFVLWLLLTLIWISYSSSAGSGPRVAFIPPALVLIALVFTWLLKGLVVRFTGESEPLHFHSYWGSALPLSNFFARHRPFISGWSGGRRLPLQECRCADSGVAAGAFAGAGQTLADQNAHR